MKKRKDPTEPVACRISPELKEKYEEEADYSDLSLAEYVTTRLLLAENVECSIAELETSLAEAKSVIDFLDTQLSEEQNLIWKREPFAIMLADVLKNEQILAKLFAVHGSKPIESNELIKKGFMYNVLLQSENQSNRPFYFTGLYGWAFSDSTKKHVEIIKKQ